MTKMDFVEIVTDNVKWITEDAILIDYPDHPDGSVWIPRSVLSTPSNDVISAGDYVLTPLTISVHKWFVEKKGL